jgi:DNA-binding transcriptional MerR regulator
MDEQYVTHIALPSYRAPSTYSERETAALTHLGIGVLRRLRQLGLVEGRVTGGELRYSEEDVILMRRIRRLHSDLGINLEGVEVIIHLLRRYEALQRELERERQQGRRTGDSP